ncbi:MAG TPA: hypothetical protein VHC21_01090 [Candidatus Saccharimonadales bacterium]|nr:hypothetical protein [Candidatus Saccharimonadales bacterium]
MSNAEKVFEKYIKGTPPQAIVRDLTIVFCSLTNAVQRVCKFRVANVHITTKVLKKNYDKRTAQENDFLLKSGWKVVRIPDEIYLNKSAKRGDYLFAKRINNDLYVASIEVEFSNNIETLYVVSMFKVRKESYLSNYKLVWSWKGGEPSS